MDHLDEMEHLRYSVNLRAYGQRDPLVEYKTEGHRMFQGLLGAFESQVAGLIFKVGAIPAGMRGSTPIYTPIHADNISENQRPVGVNPRQSASPKVGRPTVAKAKVGRNDPCPCGAKHPDGRPIKYKKCHGK